MALYPHPCIWGKSVNLIEREAEHRPAWLVQATGRIERIHPFLNGLARVSVQLTWPPSSRGQGLGCVPWVPNAGPRAASDEEEALNSPSPADPEPRHLGLYKILGITASGLFLSRK